MGLWPGATPFELSDGVASPVLDEIVQGPAAALTAVALVAGPRARASGWAAQAAVAVASRWRGRRQPVLVDLDLTAPALHELTGTVNEEGVADVIDFGLSLSAVTQRADAGFSFVAAGEYAPEPASVLRSDAWTRVLLEVAAERRTLLAWVPAEAEGMRAIVQRAGAIIVLAERDEADAIVQRLPHPYAVLAVLSPAGQEPVVAAAAADAVLDEPPADAEPVVEAAAAADALMAEPQVDTEPVVEAAAANDVVAAAEAAEAAARAEDADADRRVSDEAFEQIRLPKDRASRDELIAELRERQRAARMAPPPVEARPRRDGPAAPAAGGAAAAGAGRRASRGDVLLPASGSEHAREMRLETAGDDLSLDAIDPGPPAPRRSRYRRPLAWTIVLVLMLSVLAGAWKFLAGRLGWGVAVEDPVPTAVEPAPAPPRVPVVEEVELPWVVAIEAHTDLVRANNRLASLRNAALELPFHVVALERENRLFYHVMAGPVQDSARAVALRDTLIAMQLKTAALPNDIRLAPLSFLIGDYGTRDVALQQIDELQRLDIPSYLLLGDAADGYPMYRVYVGAYTAPGEAEVGRQLLRAVGVRDSLVTRTGSIVP